MIRVFDWGSSLNVVDDNNNFVGYSLEDRCCAHGGYFIAKTEHLTSFDGEIEDKVIDKEFPNYMLDKTYFKNGSDGEGSVIVFRLNAFDYAARVPEPPLYLHLFNVHNGYYAKGFKCTFGEKREGDI